MEELARDLFEQIKKKMAELQAQMDKMQGQIDKLAARVDETDARVTRWASLGMYNAGIGVQILGRGDGGKRERDK